MIRFIGRLSLLLLVILVAMEVSARTEDRVRYGTAWFSPYREQAEMIVRDADGVHGRRSAQYQKWGMDSLGFRGPEIDSAPPPGTLRVVAAGASETFGLYESEGKEYPRQLQDSLTAALPALTCLGASRVEVLNAAMAGMTLPTVSQDVRLRLRRFQPNVIVYYPTPSQYLNDEMPVAARPDSNPAGPSGPDWRRSLHPRVFDRLREQAKLLLPAGVQDYLRTRMVQAEVARHGPGWRWDSLPADRLDAYETDLRLLVGVIRSIGAEPVLATHGSIFALGQVRDPGPLHMWERFYPRATGEVILAFDSAAAVRTRRVARDSATGFADVLHEVEPAGYADNIHFNDAGAGRVAGTMAVAVVAAAKRAGCAAAPGD
jgi:hypothetical protein